MAIPFLSDPWLLIHQPHSTISFNHKNFELFIFSIFYLKSLKITNHLKILKTSHKSINQRINHSIRKYFNNKNLKIPIPSNHTPSESTLQRAYNSIETNNKHKYFEKSPFPSAHSRIGIHIHVR